MADQGKPSRRFKVVLACSLALNLLVVAMVAGAVWRHGGGGKGGGHSFGPGMQGYAAPYVRALPKEDRRAVHKAIRDSAPQDRRAARRDIYQKMLSALRAEPFDAEAVRDVLQGQRDLVLKVQSTAQAQWMSSIKAMSPQDRAAYADRLEASLKKRRGRKDKRPRD